MSKVLLVVDAKRELLLQRQLATMGFTFDISSEIDAEQAVERTDYLMIFVEANESGCLLAQRLHTAPCLEQTQPAYFIGILPRGHESPTFHVLPTGMSDIISTPIRNDALYECVCCAGSSLKNEEDLEEQRIKEQCQREPISANFQHKELVSKHDPASDRRFPDSQLVASWESQHEPPALSIPSLNPRQRITGRGGSVTFRGPMPAAMALQLRRSARSQWPYPLPLPRAARVAKANF
jgi:hypothetical protein